MGLGQTFAGPTDTRNLSQYFSTHAGGRKSFNATGGAQTIGATGGLALIVVNPANSGVDVFIDKIVLSADTAGRYERCRNGTITIGSASVSVINRGGGQAAPACKIYPPASNSVTTHGTVGVVTFIGASQTEQDPVGGSIILRPGENIYWTFLPKVSGSSTSLNAIEVVWWEEPAKP